MGVATNEPLANAVVGQGLVLNSSGQLVSGSSREMWIARVAARFGVNPQQISMVWVDFESGAGLAAPTVTATAAQQASPALDGGWLSYTVGDGTAAGRVQVRLASVIGQVPIHWSNAKTAKWMFGFRGKLTTAAGAHTRLTVANGSANFYAGIDKLTNATKFVFLPGSGPIASTVSFDTNTHEVAAGNDGGSVAFISVDGEAEVQGSNAGMPTSQDQIEIDFNTNALEAAQTFQLDYFFLASVRS